MVRDREKSMKIVAYEVREDEKGIMRQLAESLGIELVITEKTLSAETLSFADGVDGVTILGKSRLDKIMLAALREHGCRVLSTRTMGCDHINLSAAEKEGIHVFHASYDPDGVAEFTVMLMLMALRHYKQALYRANANDYSLAGLMGKELRNMTVGVIGCGKIGERVIEILKGFGCRILAYNRTPARLEKMGLPYTPLELLYAKSDIITLHVPLQESTRHMINKETVARMKNGVILINCARGSLIDIEAAIDGIESRKIGALGLDVIEDEDGIYHQDRRSDILINRGMAYIRQFPNVVLTQHMAFYTEEAVKSMVASGIEQIVNFCREIPYK